MTNLEKIRWLQEYRALEAEVSKKREEYERIRALCEKTTSVATGMPHGGCGEHDALYARMIDLAQELSIYIGGLANVREQICEAVGAVQDEQLRALLEYRYLRGWSWREVAGQLGQQECTVRGRLHKKAIETLHVVYGVEIETQHMV